MQQVNAWRYGDGQFAWVGGANVIRYSNPPVKLEELEYGIRGAFELIDDLVIGKASPILRKAIGIQDRQPQDATSGSKTSIRPGSNRIAA